MVPAPDEEVLPMRDMLAWMVEQICRPLDTRVCALANVTDEDDTFPGYYIGA
jgi:hypothetical protein